jgi:hypothetical protein
MKDILYAFGELLFVFAMLLFGGAGFITLARLLIWFFELVF